MIPSFFELLQCSDESVSFALDLFHQRALLNRIQKYSAASEIELSEASLETEVITLV